MNTERAIPALGRGWERRAALFVALAASIVVGGVAPPAAGAPSRPSKDRTDNTLYLSYDAGKGSIEHATSSRRLDSDDKVDFLVKVKSIEAAQEGERLRGTLTLRLNGEERVDYDGEFRFIVKDSEGCVVHEAATAANIHLRPKPGKRRAYLHFVFDLPTGDYKAYGRFTAS